MAIPDYQSVMLPLLSTAADGKEHQMREVIKKLADEFQLTDAERAELLPSGNHVFENRVYWARTYLKKAGLLANPRWGCFQITDRGRNVLAQRPANVNISFLKQFPEFLEYYSTGRKSSGDEHAHDPQAIASETPEELLASGYLKLRKQLEFDLLARIKAAPPDFFERLVVRLLTTIGYGGSLADAGKAIGKSGDGGIDGVIKEDKLGLDLLYIQAKRWDNAVDRTEIQKFVGALHGKKARKGIFITTSTFTRGAKEYAEGVETKLVLIDGAQLAELMFDYGVGVSTESTYVVKRIDSDFFEDEEGPETATEAAAK
jgi:restriction system protein